MTDSSERQFELLSELHSQLSAARVNLREAIAVSERAFSSLEQLSSALEDPNLSRQQFVRVERAMDDYQAAQLSVVAAARRVDALRTVSQAVLKPRAEA